MKLIYLISSAIPVLFSVNMCAQVATTPQKNAQLSPTTQKKTAPTPTMASASDSLKKSVNAFSTLFKGHKDTSTIMISDIDFEDSNLTILKENIKKLKGVRSVSEQYKSNNATLKILFKGKPTDLWEELPANTKAPFKLIEASNNSIALKLKTAK